MYVNFFKYIRLRSGDICDRTPPCGRLDLRTVGSTLQTIAKSQKCFALPAPCMQRVKQNSVVPGTPIACFLGTRVAGIKQVPFTPGMHDFMQVADPGFFSKQL